MTALTHDGMDWLRDRTVLVLGLGESGLAMARWCARLGAGLRVWDSRDDPARAARLAEQLPEAQRWHGTLDVEALAEVSLVLKSPGLSPFDARIAPLLARAAALGIAVQGELDLFARALADLRASMGYAPKVLAVTGTNGKTTTTAMTAALVERAGRRVAVAGNIGPTMLQTLADALGREAEAANAAALRQAQGEREREDAVLRPADGEPEEEAQSEPEGAHRGPVRAEPFDSAQDRPVEALVEAGPIPHDAEPSDEVIADLRETHGTADLVFLHLPEVWVIELSSFQLDGVRHFEPDAAAILNLTQDHLDWHGTLAHYAAAKARVFGANALIVVNRDDLEVEALLPTADADPSRARRKAPRPVAPPRRVVRFGLGAPRVSGDFGLVDENGLAWLVRAVGDDDIRPRGRGRSAADSDVPTLQRLMPADALRVRGRHNAANALAALALATAIGCPLAPMLHALREYAGEPHRLAFVASLDGIDAYDDSKGTNVGATVAALNGLGADRAPARLVVILGGDGKQQDFAPLAEPVRRHARAVATIGRDAEAIESALAGAGVPVVRHPTLEAATRWCFTAARPGDAVLLSPACASFDMFRGYAHRAEVFVAEIRAIAAEAGVAVV